MDGLASGSALFTALTMISIALTNNHVEIVIVLCVLVGAILGFLRYNFNPATIFLGDSGSLCIGFTLAALSILGTQKSTTMITMVGPIFSFGFPIFETLLSIIRRLLAGQPIFKADRDKVTIEDVIAVEGPRLPAVDKAQKKFNTGIVVIVENGATPSRELIQRANGIREQWIDYWTTTTGHRSTMTASPK